MTTTNSSAKPRDVELVEKKLHLPKEKENTVDVNITFCAYVGCDGISLMFLSLGVGGLFIYITYMYTKSFQAWFRPWVWTFAVLAMLYGLLVIKWMWTWKHLAETFTELQGGDEEKNLHGDLTLERLDPPPL